MSERLSATNEEIQTAAASVYNSAYNVSQVAGFGRLSDSECKAAQNRVLQGLLPHPVHPARMSQALHKVVGFEGGADFGSSGLNSADAVAVGDIDIFGEDAGGWHGKTAMVFKDFYVDPFDNCRRNQIDAIRELDIAIRTYRSALDRRRGDYVTIAQTTADALDAVTAIPFFNFNDASLSLAIIGSVVAVSGAIPSGGGSLSALAVVGAASGAVSTGISVAKSIEGSFPDSIVASMNTALNGVDAATESIGNEMANLLDDYRNDVFEPEVTATIVEGRKPVLLPREPTGEEVLTLGEIDGLNRPS